MLGEITFHRLPCNRLAHRCITLSKYGVWAGISVPASHYRVTTNPAPVALATDQLTGRNATLKRPLATTLFP